MKLAFPIECFPFLSKEMADDGFQALSDFRIGLKLREFAKLRCSRIREIVCVQWSGSGLVSYAR